MKRLSKYPRFLGLSLCLALAPTWARAELKRCPEPVGPRPGYLGVGLVIQSNAPSHLPDFQIPVASYGLVLLYPIQRHRVYLQGTYGKEGGLQIILSEVGFRGTIPTPFFSVLLLGGVHYLSYDNLNVGRQYASFGAHGGTGLSFDLGSSLEAMLNLKLMLQETPIFAYGASLSIML